ncbi:acyltransferase family protein [Leucobacter sp. GX24907]
MTQPSAAVQAPPASKPRVALWDNARFLLIVLVVVGHTISTARMETPLGFGLYVYAYLFHMPAMILLSGVFSRTAVTPKSIRSTFQLLLTWGLWEGIWALLRFAVEEKGLPASFLVSPSWTLWFLVTLVTLRIVLPVIALLKHPLLVSFGLALMAGLLPAIGADFSASRTFCFLPFFVLGWMARDRGWLEGRWFVRPTIATRAIAWGVLGVAAIGLAVQPQLRDTWRIDSWLRWRDDYFLLFDKAPIGDAVPESLWGVALAGLAIRALLLGIAVVMTLALLIVTPRGESIITVWGARTLYVYLLHGPIVWGLRQSGVVDAFGDRGSVGIAVLALLAVGLAVVLSMRWVTVVFRRIIEPRFEWMMQRS